MTPIEQYDTAVSALRALQALGRYRAAVKDIKRKSDAFDASRGKGWGEERTAIRDLSTALREALGELDALAVVGWSADKIERVVASLPELRVPALPDVGGLRD